MDCSVGGFFLRVGEWGELKGARWRWFFFFLSFFLFLGGGKGGAGF